MVQGALFSRELAGWVMWEKHTSLGGLGYTGIRAVFKASCVILETIVGSVHRRADLSPLLVSSKQPMLRLFDYCLFPGPLLGKSPALQLREIPAFLWQLRSEPESLCQ